MLVCVGFSDDDSSETGEENEVPSTQSATEPPENKMADESSSAGVDSDESDDDDEDGDDVDLSMMHSTSWNAEVVTETTSTAQSDGSGVSVWQSEALLL